jgi:hypothetical protein
LKEDPLVIHLETIDAINYDDIILNMPIEVDNEFDNSIFFISIKWIKEKVLSFLNK